MSPEMAGHLNQLQMLLQAEQTRGILSIRTAIGTGQIAAACERQAQHAQWPRPLIKKR